MNTPEEDRKTDKPEKGYIFPEKRASRAVSFGGALGRASVIGLHPLSGILVGGAAGYFLWKHFEAQWIFWVLLLLGFVAGCQNAIREMRNFLREQEGSENVAKKP